MLIFLAILFLYGAVGMERRRGLFFSIVTAGLIFSVSVPLLVRDAGSIGPLFALIELAGALLGILVLAVGSFFVGRLARIVFIAVRAKRAKADSRH